MVNSVDMYQVITEFKRIVGAGRVAHVSTKYKTVDRKMRLVTTPLLEDNWGMIKGITTDLSLRDPREIGHQFIDETLHKLIIGGGGFLLPAKDNWFRRMIKSHGKASAFSSREIGCVDPIVVKPMVIFTIPYVSWNLKPIPVPRAHIPKLMELLTKKVNMRILEPSSTPYSN